ncbi:sugar-transfer associated ATP-grasp domain-containing protein [Trinickia diaoshuihuensis]|uniref:sugar-transfer associated ATP-grasp domain-containing protein n=1 Tax=Trinickia diaoshuihuensis TaxID=2292265 RepID=UPI000E25D5E2|nr:sugar-transfer associated ATP-grasp domain-containing protein [Trinickia diaoshuihuensis]
MKTDAEVVARRWARRLFDVRFHRSHRAQALAIHKTLEQYLGKTRRADLERADAYARDVLGHARYAPWLYVYAAIAGRFKEGWIPDNYYGHVVVPKVKGNYGMASSLKSLQRTIFNSDAFPDLAYFANGLFMQPDATVIAPDALVKRLFAKSDVVIFKVDNSLQGRGIFFFDRPTFDIEKVKALGNGVFQENIAQHDILGRFAPRSVATLRITTAVNDEGIVSARACYLRLGRDADTHVKSSSHVRIPVHCATGELGEHGYLTDWTVVREHPDSKIRFAGVKVPAFQDCLATVLDHHRKVPYARCVGWDVAVDEDERVKLMEWNAEHNDIKFSEATQGPCFADLRWDRLAPKHRAEEPSMPVAQTDPAAGLTKSL